MPSSLLFPSLPTLLTLISQSIPQQLVGLSLSLSVPDIVRERRKERSAISLSIHPSKFHLSPPLSLSLSPSFPCYISRIDRSKAFLKRPLFLLNDSGRQTAGLLHLLTGEKERERERERRELLRLSVSGGACMEMPPGEREGEREVVASIMQRAAEKIGETFRQQQQQWHLNAKSQLDHQDCLSLSPSLSFSLSLSPSLSSLPGQTDGITDRETAERERRWR